MRAYPYLFLIIVLSFLSASQDRIPIIDNFHEIDPGNFYRSAQLSAKTLTKKINQYGIKTIINLRGENVGKDWYDEEKSVADKTGVTLINIRMSAKRLPHKADLITLLDAYHNAARPILVHCRAGADRTGEAAAIYLLEHMNATKKEALKMQTIKYFHVSKLFPAKRYFVKLYEGESWAKEFYDPCIQTYEYYDQSKYCNNNFIEEDGDDT